MAIIVKEEQKIIGNTKTYLQRYEEHVRGYKQYKKEHGKLENPATGSWQKKAVSAKSINRSVTG